MAATYCENDSILIASQANISDSTQDEIHAKPQTEASLK